MEKVMAAEEVSSNGHFKLSMDQNLEATRNPWATAGCTTVKFDAQRPDEVL